MPNGLMQKIRGSIAKAKASRNAYVQKQHIAQAQKYHNEMSRIHSQQIKVGRELKSRQAQTNKQLALQQQRAELQRSQAELNAIKYARVRQMGRGAQRMGAGIWSAIQKSQREPKRAKRYYSYSRRYKAPKTYRRTTSRRRTRRSSNGHGGFGSGGGGFSLGGGLDFG
jgi:hypothetical protein